MATMTEEAESKITAGPAAHDVLLKASYRHDRARDLDELHRAVESGNRFTIQRCLERAMRKWTFLELTTIASLAPDVVDLSHVDQVRQPDPLSDAPTVANPPGGNTVASKGKNDSPSRRKVS